MDVWQNLYALGARKIGVTTLPPLGCLPAAITLFGSHSNECVDRLNNDALNFNTKLNTTSQNLQKELSNLTLAVLDIYQPLHDLVTKPTENGKLHNCLFDFFYILLLVMAHEQGLWIIFLLLHTTTFFSTGFYEARKACCGTGLIETSILCNKDSIGTCANATEYVFWDGFHPSEAANKVLADDLLISGISLIS